MAPRDRGVHRPQPIRLVAGAAGEQIEATAQPGVQLGRRQHLAPRCGELDGEWQPIELRTDRLHERPRRLVKPKPTLTARARVANSATASSESSGGTATSCSPRRCSGRRLVTRIETLGATARSSATNPAADVTCSKLSRTNSRSRSRSVSNRRSTSCPVPMSTTPIDRAIVAGTRSGSLTGARSTKSTPSLNPGPACSSRAISIASRVLPMPPGPSSDTSRTSGSHSRSVTRASSVRRPRIDVVGAGMTAARRSTKSHHLAARRLRLRADHCDQADFA